MVLLIIECCGCGLVYTDIDDGTKDMPEPCPKCKCEKAKLLKCRKINTNCLRVKL